VTSDLAGNDDTPLRGGGPERGVVDEEEAPDRGRRERPRGSGLECLSERVGHGPPEWGTARAAPDAEKTPQ